jgi:hypothetical protein
MRALNRYSAIFGLSLLMLGAVIHIVNAQQMSSTNYQIEFDSINAGGTRSTSDSYTLEDTAGEIATGRSASTNYSMRAGYQQMNETYLALTAPDDVVMTPAIGGVTGGTSNGSTTVTVTTDSAAGYQLSIFASSSPAMQGETNGGTIADYAPESADPDYTFAFAANEAVFGFTVEGTDIPDRFKDNGNACATGASDNTDQCWDGLATTEKVIAERTSANHPNGTETVMKFRVGIGTSVNQTPDTYTATTTITLLAR